MKKSDIILGILFLVIGIYFGRKTSPSEVVTEYVKGDTVTVIDTLLSPVEVVVPKYVTLPQKYDTVLVGDTTYVLESVDTSEILADYILKRSYEQTLIQSDTSGLLKVAMEVQYNKLKELTYTFVPVEKVIITPTKKKYTPYLVATINTYNYYGLGLGIYQNAIGLQIKYLNSFARDGPGLEFGVTKKF